MWCEGAKGGFGVSTRGAFVLVAVLPEVKRVEAQQEGRLKCCPASNKGKKAAPAAAASCRVCIPNAKLQPWPGQPRPTGDSMRCVGSISRALAALIGQRLGTDLTRSFFPNRAGRGRGAPVEAGLAGALGRRRASASAVEPRAKAGADRRRMGHQVLLTDLVFWGGGGDGVKRKNAR